MMTPKVSFRIGSSMGCRYRSEEHTSELQSHSDIVCRLLLEKNCMRSNTRVGSWGLGAWGPSGALGTTLQSAEFNSGIPFFFLKNPATPETNPFPLPDSIPF